MGPPNDWRRRIGRPRQSWLRTVEDSLRPLNFGLATARRCALDRLAWRLLVETDTSTWHAPGTERQTGINSAIANTGTFAFFANPGDAHDYELVKRQKAQHFVIAPQVDNAMHLRSAQVHGAHQAVSHIPALLPYTFPAVAGTHFPTPRLEDGGLSKPRPWVQ